MTEPQYLFLRLPRGFLPSYIADHEPMSFPGQIRWNINHIDCLLEDGAI